MRVLLIILAIFLIPSLATASCVSNGGIELCKTDSYDFSGSLTYLAISHSHNTFLTKNLGSNTFHTLNSTFSPNSSCNSIYSSLSGVDVINNTVYTWYQSSPGSFPSSPVLGKSLMRLNETCSLVDASYLSNSEDRYGISHNTSHLFFISQSGASKIIESYRIDDILDVNRSTLVQPLLSCVVDNGADGLHVNLDGSFWTGNLTHISYYLSNCTRSATFYGYDLIGSYSWLYGMTSNNNETLLWLSHQGGNVSEFLIKDLEYSSSVSNYPDGSSVKIYQNQSNAVKLKVSGSGNVAVYPAFSNGTRIAYDQIVNGIQIVWASHDQDGYHLDDDMFVNGSALVYLTVIEYGNNLTSIPVNFIVEDLSTGKIIGEDILTFGVIGIDGNQTPLYYERFHPEDHIFGVVNISHPEVTFDYRNDSLEVFFNGVSVSNISGDVDDLRDSWVIGPHEDVRYGGVYYYNDTHSGNDYWVIRLWFGWFKDGSDAPSDQFPDMEAFDIWVNKSMMSVSFIETFIHYSAWWFEFDRMYDIIVGDISTGFAVLDESHTISVNGHTALFYSKYLANLFDPSNDHLDILHTSGGEDAFGIFETIQESIDTYVSVDGSSLITPTSANVDSSGNVSLGVTVVNDGTIHDTLYNKSAYVEIAITRSTISLLDVSVETFNFTYYTEPLIETDVPAGMGVTRFMNWTSPDSSKGQIDTIFAKSKVDDITDTDFIVLIPYESNDTVSNPTFVDYIDTGITKAHSMVVGTDASILVTYLNWFGSDLDVSLVDPLGRRVGFNRSSSTFISEVPEVNYSGYLSKPEIITIVNPEQGNWSIEIYANETDGNETYVVSSIVLIEDKEPEVSAPIELLASQSSSGGGSAAYSFLDAVDDNETLGAIIAIDDESNSMVDVTNIPNVSGKEYVRVNATSSVEENNLPSSFILFNPSSIGIKVGVLLVIFTILLLVKRLI